MKKILMILACLMAVSVLKAETIDWIILTRNASVSRNDFGMLYKEPSIYMFGGNYQDLDLFQDCQKSNNGVDWIEQTSFINGVEIDVPVLYYDNKIWTFGTTGGTQERTIISNSADDGVTWTTVLESNVNVYPRRRYSSVVVFNNEMYIVAGMKPPPSSVTYNDVWKSTNGVDWIAVTRNAEFPARNNNAITVFDDKIWVAGGYSQYGVGGTYYNDVWNSADGVEWTAVTRNAEFTAYDSQYLWSYNGKLYYYVDVSEKVWSSEDGVEWTEVTMTGDVPLARRESGMVTMNDGKNLIVAYGYEGVLVSDYVYMAEIIDGTETPIETPTITPSFTSLPTVDTPTPSTTPTVTLSNTPLPTDTITETNTPYYSPTASWTNTPWDTFTLTETITPTPSITATITQTRTITPLTTPTPTNTVTPILTLEPILRYVSTDYDNHKTTIRLEWTKYDDTGLQYYLTVYDPIYQHESTTVLSNLADISPDLEWLTHDLIGLRYDYCYNIGLTITSSNWSEPVYADTIVICPYESPTPPSFETYTPSHTPTAVWTQQDNITIANLTPQNTQIPIPTGVAIISEPTPEWTQVQPLATVWVYMINWPTPIPTATATATTAYTLTRTTLGLLKYDDFEDGIAGAVYNAAIYTANSGTFTYRARPGSAGIGPLGNISLEYTNNANIYLGVSTVADVSYRLSAWIYIAGGRKHAMYAKNGRNAWFSGQQFSVGNFATYNRVWLPNITYAGNWFFYDGYFPDGAAPDSNYGLSCNFYTADSGNALTHLNPTLLGSGIYNIGLDSSTEENLGYIRFQVDSAAAGALYDNVCVELGRFVLFSGLTPGYRVDIIDANTLRPVQRVKRPTIQEPLTSVVDVGDNYCKIDLMGNTPGREVYIRIYDTNNILISTTGPTQVWGGDVWELTTP